MTAAPKPPTDSASEHAATAQKFVQLYMDRDDGFAMGDMALELDKARAAGYAAGQEDMRERAAQAMCRGCDETAHENCTTFQDTDGGWWHNAGAENWECDAGRIRALPIEGEQP